jgi:schlafen family protein
MADALSNLFRSLDSEAAVQTLVDARAPEGLHLEFKRKHDRAKPDLDSGDSWHFSRALSGFANSDGGILLWGVGTDRRDGLDRASVREAIVGHETFVARLGTSLLDAVIPMVDGVEIEPLPSADPRVGYAKCLIPRSEQTPHRGMLADREYYKRSPEGFYRLEHFDLEDMFGRRPLPRLSFTLQMVRGGSDSSAGTVNYRGWAVFGILNEGRGSARAPYLAVTTTAHYAVAPPSVSSRGDGLTRFSTSVPYRVVFTSGDVAIHQGVTHEIASIGIYTTVNHRQAVTIPPELRVSYQLSADNARVMQNELVISGREIARVVLPDNLHENIPPE